MKNVDYMLFEHWKGKESVTSGKRVKLQHGNCYVMNQKVNNKLSHKNKRMEGKH